MRRGRHRSVRTDCPGKRIDFMKNSIRVGLIKIINDQVCVKMIVFRKAEYGLQILFEGLPER